MTDTTRFRPSSIFVVGAGGLGCPALRHLASSGVARLGLAEFDRVEVSNLPRQTLYRETDIGRAKVDVAAEALARLPGSASVTVETYAAVIRGDEEFLSEYDVVIDAIDRADQKLALHDRVVARGIRFVHAAATGWEGQGLSVTGSGCLRCLFGDSSDPDAPDCRRAGIVGPVVGLVGLLAADEALRLIEGRTGRWERSFWSVDARTGRCRRVPIEPRADCSVCGR
jgi:molybdopterin/thiamine biosynthesis adenylyltransferase